MKIVFCLILSVFGAFSAAGADIPEPRQEKLLNGLRILVWERPEDTKLIIKLRVHSGAVFDPKNKAGVMALLAESIFPTEQSRAYFEEDLHGSLKIDSNFDYIQLTVSAKSGDILPVLETLSSSVTNPPLTPENFVLVRNQETERLEVLNKVPAYSADLLAAQRLFGDFPYGRSPMGSKQSLAVIDKTDLSRAAEKFLTADNCTLSIEGNVKAADALKAARRYFGGWRKSDNLTPATFAEPPPPDPALALVHADGPGVREFRIAFRGPSRGDKDYYPALALSLILDKRIRATAAGSGTFVRFPPTILSGMVLIGISGWEDKGAGAAADGNKPQDKIVTEALKVPVIAAELDQSLKEISAARSRREPSEIWLDADTYKLAGVREDNRSFGSTDIAAVQKTADRWAKQPRALIYYSSEVDSRK
jgi:Peptidase M16 inactive domain/Insulinase (Peptidase family M16)